MSVTESTGISIGVLDDLFLSFLVSIADEAGSILRRMDGMLEWPATRMTLLDRLRDRQDQDAWGEFIDLYGPLVFHFARRRLPQDHDAADVMQEVLRAVMGGSYERPKGRFQKWLVTVLLNKIRNFHSAPVRRHEVSGSLNGYRLQEEPSRVEEEEWEQERQRHLLHAAAERVRARTNPIHWDAFVRTALHNQPGQEVAMTLGMSLTNVYAVKCRVMKDVKDEIQRLSED
jgi:RNA polymerase sigma-70 factor (ECF subfamily)